MTALPTPDELETTVRAGQVLGRYELLLPIAAGGMAMVWAARMKGTRGFQKIVAVKTMLPKLSEDEQFEQMFLDEASLASQIRHPNAVEIMDLGEQNGVLYLVMEWIEGIPLNQLMKAAKKQGGVPHRIAVRLAIQACAGLHAAHELKDAKGQLVGLVHRDVSPQNLLVTYEGVTKVVDFGVAKATAAGDGATQAGQIKGKVGYMAPEQVKGEAIDRRVDVFALGIVLYALTTGKHPFRRESEAATMYNICAAQPVMPPRKVVQNYPPELEAVVLKALAKNRNERYTTANEMLKALNALPTALRSTTDYEVGLFVTGLLGDKYEEQRRALSAAIERANQQVESGMRTAMPALPTPERDPSLVGTAELTSGNLSGLNQRNTGAWVFASLSVLLAGGAVAAYVLTQPLEPVVSSMTPEAPLAEPPAADKPEAEAANEDGQGSAELEDAVSIDDLDSEPKPVPEPKATPSPPPQEEAAKDAKPGRSKGGHPSGKPTDAAQKKPENPPTWDKENPGF